MHIWQKYMTFSSYTHCCCESKSVAIYALYPESFRVQNLAIWKVFAFSDSAAQVLVAPVLVAPVLAALVLEVLVSKF